MKNESTGFAAGVICGGLLSLIIGWIVIGGIVNGVSDNYWHYHIIQHNCAHYDQKTGEWKWNMTLPQTDSVP